MPFESETPSFELYLIRHGLAGQLGDYDDDSQRPLTPEGQRKTRKVADRLAHLGIEFDELRSSPYQRAWQTAEVLQAAGLVENIEPLSALEPEGDWTVVVDYLKQTRQAKKRVAIVGHEPDLSELAARLVFGDRSEHLKLKKAGVIGLTGAIEGELIGRCELFWLTPPRLLLN